MDVAVVHLQGGLPEFEFRANGKCMGCHDVADGCDRPESVSGGFITGLGFGIEQVGGRDDPDQAVMVVDHGKSGDVRVRQQLDRTRHRGVRADTDNVGGHEVTDLLGPVGRCGWIQGSHHGALRRKMRLGVSVP